MQAALNTPWQQSDSYRCLDCGAPFNSESSLNSHSEKCHPDTLTYTCPHCSLSFLDSLQLSQHLPSHSAEGCLKEGTERSQSGSYVAAYSRSFGKAELSALQVTDWTEEGTNTLSDCFQPIVGIEYVCKICGQILPRLAFCRHMYHHHSDIYLPRGSGAPRQITNDFIVQTGVPLLGRATLPPATLNGPCRVCALSEKMIRKLRDVLEALLRAGEKDQSSTLDPAEPL